jgi:hypothetical protein
MGEVDVAGVAPRRNPVGVDLGAPNVVEAVDDRDEPYLEAGRTAVVGG